MAEIVYPMTYEEYKQTVKEYFMERCLQDIPVEERLKHFEENEDIVKDGYWGECRAYRNSKDKSKCFTMRSITSSSQVLWSLENLY